MNLVVSCLIPLWLHVLLMQCLNDCCGDAETLDCSWLTSASHSCCVCVCVCGASKLQLPVKGEHIIYRMFELRVLRTLETRLFLPSRAPIWRSAVNCQTSGLTARSLPRNMAALLLS